MTEFPKIAVIGAGLMGHGIAQVFALQGCAVRIYDPFPESLRTVHDRVRANLRALGEDEAAADRIELLGEIAATVRDADFVIETALENLDLKRKLFAEIEISAPAQAIFHSNTSVIPITEIMRELKDRSRGVGTHWWNPPYLVPLVEVVGTEWTAPEAVAKTMTMLADAGKTPVRVKRDVPGFIGNRMQHALWREAISMVEHGICDAEDIDTVVKASFGARLPVLGPLENADLVGTDLTLAIHETVLADLETSGEPSPYLRELVASGRLGMKSGQGFKSWTPETMAALRARVTEHLKAARDKAKSAGAAK